MTATTKKPKAINTGPLNARNPKKIVDVKTSTISTRVSGAATP